MPHYRTSAAATSAFDAVAVSLRRGDRSPAAVAYIASTAMPPKPKLLSFDLYRFGQIPVVSEGRVQSRSIPPPGRHCWPFRDERQIDEEYDEAGEGKNAPSRKGPADSMAAGSDHRRRKLADDRDMFRVENLELQETIGVKKREGMRYSRNDIRERDEELEKQVKLAREQAEKDRKQLSVFQKKVLELSDKVSTLRQSQVCVWSPESDRRRNAGRGVGVISTRAQLSEDPGRTRSTGLCRRAHATKTKNGIRTRAPGFWI